MSGSGGITNLFLGPYEQPENKLTYSLLSLLEHVEVETAQNVLSLLGLTTPRIVDLEIGLLYGGGLSNPDGRITIKSDSGRESAIYLENKTWRRSMDLDQIKRHMLHHVQRPQDHLLVITTAKSDDSRLKALSDSRIHHACWDSLAKDLDLLSREVGNQKDRFLLAQFVDYVERSGEAWRARMLDRNLVATYSEYLKLESQHSGLFGSEEKLRTESRRLMRSIESDVAGHFVEQISSSRVTDNWGRVGAECALVHNELGQWVFFGVYFDTHDHLLPFKEPNQPEFAVFFDMNPVNRARVAQLADLKPTIDELGNKGFEFNLEEVTGVEKTSNRWRLCFWREPVAAYLDKDVHELRDVFIHRLETLLDSRFFELVDSLSRESRSQTPD